MTRPYSDDLRSRVAASVLSGRTCVATAVLFGVSVASAAKWSRRLRLQGTAAAKPMGGARRAALINERAWLLARIASAPDLTLRAIQAELAERGISVSLWTIWSFYEAAGISFKKKHSAGRTGARRHRKPKAPLGLATAAH